MLSIDTLNEVGTYLDNSENQSCIPIFGMHTYDIKRLIKSPQVKGLLRHIIELGYTPYVQDRSVPSGHTVEVRVWALPNPTKNKHQVAVRTYYHGLLGHIWLDPNDSSKDCYIPLQT